MRKDGCAIESEVFNLLEIDADLFAYETPLGMIINEFKRLSSIRNDLFTYELGVVEDFYFPYVERNLDNLEMRVLMFMNGECVMMSWLDLRYGNHETMDKKIMNDVITTWLIRSYKKQFEDYMEIKKQKETRGDDEEVLTDEENSDLEDENLIKENKIAEIFRIETDIFDFETPLCEAFMEFNYLLKIEIDVLTNDINMSLPLFELTVPNTYVFGTVGTTGAKFVYALGMLSIVDAKYLCIWNGMLIRIDSGAGFADREYFKCLLPYNPDEYMLYCQARENWYHPDCLNMTKDEAKQRKSPKRDVDNLWKIEKLRLGLMKMYTIGSALSCTKGLLLEYIIRHKRPYIMAELEKLVGEWPLELIKCRKDEDKTALAVGLQEDIPTMIDSLSGLGVKPNYVVETRGKWEFGNENENGNMKQEGVSKHKALD
ncbi:ATP-dependent DNA helicase PIF1 [Tanacetum coccineum]